MSHSINVTLIFVGFSASQQESNRSWSSTFLPKQEQESNSFLIKSGVGVEKVRLRSPLSTTNHGFGLSMLKEV